MRKAGHREVAGLSCFIQRRRGAKSSLRITGLRRHGERKLSDPLPENHPMRAFVLLLVLLCTSACAGLQPGSNEPEGTYKFVDLDGRPPPVESEPGVFLHAATVTLDETGEFTITMATSTGAPDAPWAAHAVAGRYTVDGDTLRLIVSGDEEGVSILSGTFAQGELRLRNPDEDPRVARFVRR
jgi:hypothetical protein